MTIFLITKLFISCAVVIGLAEISKRVHPKLGGLLAGLPLGTGLSVYFISYEYGVEFLLPDLPWGIAALSSSILFSTGYWAAAVVFPVHSRTLSIAVCTAIGAGMFFLSAYALTWFRFNLPGALALFTVVFVANLWAVTRFFPVPSHSKHTFSGNGQLFVRAIAAGLIILVITSLPGAVGSRWSAVLSSFPSMLLPLLLLLHYETGTSVFPSVLKAYSSSVSTLAVFYVSYLLSAPLWGLQLAFAASYALCLIYLAAVAALQAQSK